MIAPLHEGVSGGVSEAECLLLRHGNGTRFWLAMQMNFDIWQAEQKDIVKVEKLQWEDAA
jgi:plasmid maintenance system antidote protein VapI